jgi:hypothetical protein
MTESQTGFRRSSSGLKVFPDDQDREAVLGLPD